LQLSSEMGLDQAKNSKSEEKDFIKEEFSEIFSRKEKPHDVVFIPDTFVYGDLTKKVSRILKQFTC